MPVERGRGRGGPPPAGLRTFRADNPSPLTLDGTRTHVVGRRRVAIIDPGPRDPRHTAALAAAVAGAEGAEILLTHTHPDHAEGAPALARTLGAPVRSVGAGTLQADAVMETDAGTLHVVATPGHTPDHVALHWPVAGVLFCGDMMLGGQDSALVAPPEGDLRAYFASLDRVEALTPALIVPAHGPPFTDPGEAVRRYRRHRHARLDQVREAMGEGAARPRELVGRVYGALAPGLLGAAEAATRAYLNWLEEEGEVRREGDRYRRIT